MSEHRLQLDRLRGLGRRLTRRHDRWADGARNNQLRACETTSHLFIMEWSDCAGVRCGLIDCCLRFEKHASEEWGAVDRVFTIAAANVLHSVWSARDDLLGSSPGYAGRARVTDRCPDPPAPVAAPDPSGCFFRRDRGGVVTAGRPIVPILLDVGSPDYIVDIDAIQQGDSADGGERSAGGATGRPWLAVRWRCCNVYSRVYRKVGGDAYVGRCPRCGKPVRVGIGSDGTDARFFEAR